MVTGRDSPDIPPVNGPWSSRSSADRRTPSACRGLCPGRRWRYPCVADVSGGVRRRRRASESGASKEGDSDRELAANAPLRRAPVRQGVTSIDPGAIAAERDRIRRDYRHQPPERPESSARGLHHFALLCSDVRRTIDLLPGVLEFPLTEIFENRDYAGSNPRARVTPSVTRVRSVLVPRARRPSSGRAPKGERNGPVHGRPHHRGRSLGRATSRPPTRPTWRPRTRTASTTCGTGSTRRRARSSASSRHRTPRPPPPCTARPMASSPTRSTPSRRVPDPAGRQRRGPRARVAARPHRHMTSLRRPDRAARDLRQRRSTTMDPMSELLAQATIDARLARRASATGAGSRTTGAPSANETPRVARWWQPLARAGRRRRPEVGGGGGDARSRAVGRAGPGARAGRPPPRRAGHVRPNAACSRPCPRSRRSPRRAPQPRWWTRTAPRSPACARSGSCTPTSWRRSVRASTRGCSTSSTARAALERPCRVA